MKRFSGEMIGAIGIALAACAGEHEPPNVPASDEGDASAVVGNVPDAAADADGSLPDAGATAPECSPAGWCTTRLPGDTAFTFTDIWPLEKVAFATGCPKERPLQGTIAEYDGDKWQILAPLYDAKVVWSPGENEVWAGGQSYLGLSPLTRGIRTSAGWSFTHMLPDATSVAGLWGAGPNDVYALASDGWGNHLYHLDATGTASLILEQDASSDLAIDRVVGTSSNDVWIVGHRAWCGFLAHKLDGSFVTLADATPRSGHLGEPMCQATGDALAWTSSFAWVYATAVVPGEIEIALPGDASQAGGRIHRAKLTAEGKAKITSGSDFGYSTTNLIANPRGIWASAPGDIYVAGFGVVLRNPAAFDDTSTFSYSTVMLRGSILDKQFNAIRGHAPNNLWVVGDSYALQKTTP